VPRRVTRRRRRRWPFRHLRPGRPDSFRGPTTSGHSFRAAELTVGLAEVVDRTSTGRYAGTRFTADEIKEIRYASLLHDFGKVGVREEVLVKAKKLYPQHLELIRQRVESIRRGLELRSSRRKVDHLLRKGLERFAEEAEILDAELTALVTELDAGLARVLAANEPAVMPEDMAAAIRRVALQTFEDHLGQHRAIITSDEAQILAIPRGQPYGRGAETDRIPRDPHLALSRPDPVDARAAERARDRAFTPREAERFGVPQRAPW
jgi:hypothetical protein